MKAAMKRLSMCIMACLALSGCVQSLATCDNARAAAMLATAAMARICPMTVRAIE